MFFVLRNPFLLRKAFWNLLLTCTRPAHLLMQGLLSCLRKHSSSVDLFLQCLVFRLGGGDEFLILLPRILDVGVVNELALHILEMLHRQYHAGHLKLLLSASEGISSYPRDGKEIDALINHANAAMYYAKQLRRNGFQFYSPEMSDITEGQSGIEQQLRQAIAYNECRLFYQPVIDWHSGEVKSVEPLIRWPGKHTGPSRFVPITEATGLIGPVGEWVFSEACRQYQRWRSESLSNVPIAVNVSSVPFKRKGLVDYLVRTFPLMSLTVPLFRWS